MRPFLLVALLLCLLSCAHAQREERLLVFGLQVKPIVPSNYFQAAGDVISQNGIDFSLSQQPGYSFGMLLRRNFSTRLSLETGINYVRRNYELSIADPDLDFNGKSTFRVIGYEIPVLGLVYIRLGERTYMNTAFGFSFDFFPSDVASTENGYFYQESQRREWVQLALLANLGAEYRSRKSGIFYLGASLHRPFSDSFNTLLRYQSDTKREDVFTSLNGNYLTLDFRYFFHEDPKKVGPKTKKEKKPFRKYLPF